MPQISHFCVFWICAFIFPILGDKLRAVAQELMRAADLLQDKEDDTIKNFDESKNKIATDFHKIAPEHIQARYTMNGSNGYHIKGN